MSMFENDQYRWRETYFVLFDASKRPTLEKLQQALSKLNSRFTLTNLSADEAGRFESLTVLSPDDFAALDVCYLDGEEVLEQVADLVEEMDTSDCRDEERLRLQRLRKCDGRFDVLHFEQIVNFDDEDCEEILDPSALLVVIEALAKQTGGLAVDPQTGTFF
ncbi:MAG: hypothetical protein ACYTG0_05360 [Planctomycetota bacterium]|jgi:hypothetical protein